MSESLKDAKKAIAKALEEKAKKRKQEGPDRRLGGKRIVVRVR